MRYDLLRKANVPNCGLHPGRANMWYSLTSSARPRLRFVFRPKGRLECPLDVPGPGEQSSGGPGSERELTSE